MDYNWRVLYSLSYCVGYLTILNHIEINCAQLLEGFGRGSFCRPQEWVCHSALPFLPHWAKIKIIWNCKFRAGKNLNENVYYLCSALHSILCAVPLWMLFKPCTCTYTWIYTCTWTCICYFTCMCTCLCTCIFTFPTSQCPGTWMPCTCCSWGGRTPRQRRSAARYRGAHRCLERTGQLTSHVIRYTETGEEVSDVIEGHLRTLYVIRWHLI